jgi:hypothetical protein
MVSGVFLIFNRSVQKNIMHLRLNPFFKIWRKPGAKKYCLYISLNY